MNLFGTIKSGRQILGVAMKFDDLPHVLPDILGAVMGQPTVARWNGANAVTLYWRFAKPISNTDNCCTLFKDAICYKASLKSLPITFDYWQPPEISGFDDGPALDLNDAGRQDVLQWITDKLANHQLGKPAPDAWPSDSPEAEGSEEPEIHDHTDTNTYTIVENFAIDHPSIGGKEIAIYALLCRRAHMPKKTCNASIVKLAERTGWTRKSVDKAILNLMDAGLVLRNVPEKGSSYTYILPYRHRTQSKKHKRRGE
jgi:hypothetical protein